MVAALFHQPFRGAGGAADADGLHAVEPTEVDFGRAFDVVAVGIAPQTLVEQDASVGTFAARDEEDEVVTLGEGGDGGHSVGHLTADGVKTAECGFGRDVALDEGDDFVEFVEVFRRLRIEENVA